MEAASSPTIIRTERGLSISGTRITLYDIMDYLKADWPPTLIKNWFDLSDQQISDIMNYIAAHRDEIEAEYTAVLQKAEEIRTYWEERNRQRILEIAQLPPKPGKEEVIAKLRAKKAELGLAS